MPDQLERLRSALDTRYTIEREIGRGGMAVVYQARDQRHDRVVALKVLQPKLSQSLGAKRFLGEIRLAARLQHPHLLPLYDSGEADGLLYYVSPYVAGGSLRAVLDREKRLPLAQALRLAREVADALDYAHRQQVVHRDIKPANILLEDGHAVVSDFGVARAVSAASDNTLTVAGTLIGTPAYMSPEQANDAPLDGRSDIYALGCVLFEMIAGRPPFTAKSSIALLAQRVSDPAPSLASAGAEVPSTVERLVARALGRRPEERFQSGADLALALGEAERQVAPDELRASRAALAAADHCDRGAAVRQHESGSGERVLQRRDDRRADQCLEPGAGIAGGVAHLGVHLQGPPGGRPRGGADAQRRCGARGERAAVVGPAPGDRTVDRRR